MKARVFGQRGLVAWATALAVGLVGLTGNANAQFPQLIPTRIGLVKFGGNPAVGRMYKLVSKPPRGGPLFPLPSSSPATTGGSLTVTIGSGALGCTLAPGLFNGTVGWKELGNPAGSKGYKYLNKNAPTTDPSLGSGKTLERICKGLIRGLLSTLAPNTRYQPANTLMQEALVSSTAKPMTTSSMRDKRMHAVALVSPCTDTQRPLGPRIESNARPYQSRDAKNAGWPRDGKRTLPQATAARLTVSLRQQKGSGDPESQ